LSEPRRRFSVQSRLRSFAFAFSGLRYFAVSEHNTWIHAAATVLVIGAGGLLDLSRQEWLWLVLAIGLVWMAEAFNTAIERLADAMTMERSPAIKIVKDLAAAGVLIASMTALAIGLIIFWPHVARLGVWGG
jgi:diacylglycerol kinase (ATP)